MTKKAASKIMDGLNDAIAFARGDTSRGTMHTFAVRNGVADVTADHDLTTAELSKWLRTGGDLDQRTCDQAAERLEDLEQALSVSRAQHSEALDWYDEAREQIAALKAGAAALVACLHRPSPRNPELTLVAPGKHHEFERAVRDLEALVAQT